MKKNRVLIILVLLLVGLTTACTQKSKESDSKKVDDTNGKSTESDEKKSFDQDKMDIELFNYLSTESISAQDISQIKQAYDDTKFLWNLVLPGFLTTTHYIDLTQPNTILTTVAFLPGVLDQVKIVREGTYTYRGSTISEPIKYLPKSVLINQAEQSFGKKLTEEDFNTLSNDYIPELDGYCVGDIGGLLAYSLPNEITIKRYEDTYVAIADFVDDSAESTGNRGTYYLVMKKISINGQERFVYRWAYVKVEK